MGWIIEDRIQRRKIIKWGENELNAYTLKELKSVKERIVTAQRRWRKAGVATVTSVTGRFSMAGPRVGELTPAEERLPGYLEPLPDLTSEERAEEARINRFRQIAGVRVDPLPGIRDGTIEKLYTKPLNAGDGPHAGRRLANQDLIDRFIRASE